MDGVFLGGGDSMSWLIDRRDVGLLALLAAVSLALCVLSLGTLVQARHREAVARHVVAEADSLVHDWTKRGCAPRTSALP